MTFRSRSQHSNAIPFASDWAAYDMGAVAFTEDEFEVSPTEIVLAYLRRYESFSLGRSNTATKWERLIAIKEHVEQARQNQFGAKDFEILLFVGLGGVGSNVMAQVEYFTKALGPATPDYEIAPKSLLTHIALPGVVVGYNPFAGEIVPTTAVAAWAPPQAVAKFTPSDSLVNIWIKSVSAFAREAGEAATDRLRYDKENIRQEFAKMLTDVLGTLAQQLRYENVDGQITRSGEFTSRAQIEICDTFLILPSMSTEFLNLLKRELVASIKGGWKFEGAWGCLELTSAGELFFRLEPAKFTTNREFVRARRVE
jgi:hypothetical protein